MNYNISDTKVTPGYNFTQPLLRYKWTALILFLLGGLSSLLFVRPDFESKVSYITHKEIGLAFAGDAFSHSVSCSGLRHRLLFDELGDDYILRMVVVASSEVEAIACIDNVVTLFEENEAIYLKKRRGLLDEKSIELEREMAMLRKEISEVSDEIFNASHLLSRYSYLQMSSYYNTREMERLRSSTMYAPVLTTAVKKRNKLRYALGGGLASLLLFIFLLSVVDAGTVVGSRPD